MNKNSCLDLLKDVVKDLNFIQKVVFRNEFELDKTVSFELLDSILETSLHTIDQNIEFFGQNNFGKFVLYIEEGNFIFRYLEIPNPTHKIIPETLQNTFYSDKYKTDIPLRDESYLNRIKEENESIKKANDLQMNAELNAIKDKIAKIEENFINSSNNISKDIMPFYSFLGGKNSDCGYVVVDNNLETTLLSIKNKEKYPKTADLVDFVGYAVILKDEDGNHINKIISSQFDPTSNNHISNELSAFINKNLNNGKIKKILGVSPDYLTDEYYYTTMPEILNIITEELNQV